MVLWVSMSQIQMLQGIGIGFQKNFADPLLGVQGSQWKG